MYTFSTSWLVTGLIIMVIGGCMALFYKPIADNLASGINSYENIKKYGIIIMVVGLAVATSIHTIPLNFLVSFFFKSS